MRPVAFLILILCGCGVQQNRRTVTVAAAANLNPVFEEVGRAFTAITGAAVVNSYASTVQLAQQIESGAPFDVFAAADTAHVDKLADDGKLLRDTRVVYARGKLVLWVPKPDVPVRSLRDLMRDEVRFIAIASPNAAPYGKAAVQTLQSAGLWDRVERKVAYATNINLAREYAASGNADAAFTAYSLVVNSGGRIIEIDAASHDPLDQAAAVVSSTKNMELARQFAAFLTRSEAMGILRRYGYAVRPH